MYKVLYKCHMRAAHLWGRPSQGQLLLSHPSSHFSSESVQIHSDVRYTHTHTKNDSLNKLHDIRKVISYILFHILVFHMCSPLWVSNLHIILPSVICSVQH